MVAAQVELDKRRWQQREGGDDALARSGLRNKAKMTKTNQVKRGTQAQMLGIPHRTPIESPRWCLGCTGEPASCQRSAAKARGRYEDKSS
jgi:hypothetical protein